uniref:Hydroxysteroid dehydrogenase like 2 n=1 Tax=Coturnix japonica TaxID=93934 RepID=A0A8C2SNW9_COTJA
MCTTTQAARHSPDTVAIHNHYPPGQHSKLSSHRMNYCFNERENTGAARDSFVLLWMHLQQNHVQLGGIHLTVTEGSLLSAEKVKTKRSIITKHKEILLYVFSLSHYTQSLQKKCSPCWHCTYTICKYGMSMCVLGMAEEFKGEVAVNALWPKTAIHTAAMDMLGGSGIEKQCRKTDIIADAAYCILTKPKTFTGNFIIDEVLLREEGVKDFDVYAIRIHLFLLGASQASGGAKLNKESASAGPVAETFRVIQGELNKEIVKSTQGVFQFELSGDEGGTWYLDLKTSSGSAGFGKPPAAADVVMSMSSGDFVKMFTANMAFMSGKLRIKGNMALALKLEKMLTQFNAKL